MNKTLITLALVISSTVTARSEVQVTYLGPSGTDSYASAQSSLGQVGTVEVFPAYDRRAGYWQAGSNNWVSLHPAMADESIAYGASDQYQVGVVEISGTYRASLWAGTPDSWVDLSPAGSTGSYAWSAAPDGQGQLSQVGGAVIDGASRAGLWKSTPESWTDLNPVGSAGSYAYGVWANSQVGTARVGGAWVASLWSGTRDSWVSLHPAGASRSMAFSVEGNQQVGFAYIRGCDRAMLWNGAAESYIDLSFPGATYSYAIAIEGNRQVGYARIAGVDRAILWNGSADSWVNLGWYLGPEFGRSYAIDIESDACETVITGYARSNRTGLDVAIVWRLPQQPELTPGSPGNNLYTIEQIGIAGPEFVDIEIISANLETRRVLGISRRFDSSGLPPSGQAWLWDGDQTIPVPLPDNREATILDAIDAGHTVAAVSTYGPYIEPAVATALQATESFRIGLTPDAYQQPESIQTLDHSIFGACCDTFIIGDTIPNGGHEWEYGFSSRDSWLWNGVATIQINFTGEGYTQRNRGDQSSNVVSFNRSGQVVGTSRRLRTTGPPAGINRIGNGQDVWFWDGQQTIRLGLTGGDYTACCAGISVVNRQESGAIAVNDNGEVLGWSLNYVQNMRVPWIWSNNQYQMLDTQTFPLVNTPVSGGDLQVIRNEISDMIINGVLPRDGINFYRSVVWYRSGISGAVGWLGFYDGVHVSTTGLFESYLRELTSSGFVAGHSLRFFGDQRSGASAWISNGVATTRIGLIDAAHTGVDGEQHSVVSDVNESGWAAGESTKYFQNPVVVGETAWLWDGSQTREIGAAGPANTGPFGNRVSRPVKLNDQGNVVGTIGRFLPDGGANGNDLWYYDRNSDSSYHVVGSLRSRDAYGFISPLILDDDGFVFGTYKYFRPLTPGECPTVDGPGEDRVFMYRPDIGFVDLQSVVVGGLSSANWTSLATVWAADSAQFVTGLGYFGSEGDSVLSAFVMRPWQPEAESGPSGGPGAPGTGRISIPLTGPTDPNGPPGSEEVYPCPGDANGDLLVNFADLTIVLVNFERDYLGMTGPGDADRNGRVDFADVTSVIVHFGDVCPGAEE